jgi:hypothetical protein
VAQEGASQWAQQWVVNDTTGNVPEAGEAQRLVYRHIMNDWGQENESLMLQRGAILTCAHANRPKPTSCGVVKHCAVASC